MNLRLSVFTPQMMKSYILPSITDSDYSIVLDKVKFGFTKNIVLEMQVIDNKWTFKKNTSYQIVAENTSLISDRILPGTIFSMRCPGEMPIKLSISEADISLESFKKYSLNSSIPITIGRTDNNIIRYNVQNIVGREHSVIAFTGGAWVISDKSKNGVFVNGKRVSGSYKLKRADCIDIYGLKIIYFGNIIAISAEGELSINEQLLIPYEGRFLDDERKLIKEFKKSYFHRAPRNIPHIYSENIEIEAPPSLRKPPQKPLFMTIGPSLTMAIPMLLGTGMAILARGSSGGGAFMYTGIITAVGSAIIGTIWTLVNLRFSNKEFEKSEEKRFNAYGQYLIETTDRIKEMYESNTTSLNVQYPSAAQCCQYDATSQLLWNRNTTHPDIMYYRLGLGQIPFQTKISVPKERFKIDNDELEKKPTMIHDEFQTLYNIPVGVDLLEHNLVGIVGGAGKAGAFEIVKILSAQIAASNSYTDVKMAFVYNREMEIDGQWSFAKWFPHVWKEEKKGRYIASNKNEASDLFYSIASILRMRSENATSYSLNKDVFVKPHFVLFIEDASWLDGEPVAKYLTECKKEYGITTVLLAEKYSDLPNMCDYIIYNNSEFKGIYEIGAGEEGKKNVAFDVISNEALEAFSRRLTSIEITETEVGADMPSSLDFFEMYGVKKLDDFNVEDRWKKNRTYESMKALIGKKAGDADCYLDIHEKYHGPHGLVAGTTGSGKSETLQTYMLSLAINFSPNDIAFFVIDFKGGGMANLFSDLPHSIGQISNLSGNQVRRAMLSIKSENMRRQRIFSENGVNNINNYTKLLKNGEATVPVPHLFIIIDEFAELKREEPEFMKELISVAQVGRSLGVHLILATQKPSGTVDDNIWSNSKFRLCLRVQDQQDSKDMLHKPDAAYITQAGRGYLQVGNDEIYEYFQSGWSGAPYSEDADFSTSDIVTLIGLDGKAEMVGNKQRIAHKEKKQRDWIGNLVKFADEAFIKESEPLEAFCANTMLANSIVSDIIASIQEAGIKFDDSVFNRKRLEDFVELYKSAASSEDPVGKIISISQTSGKRLPEMKEITQLDAVVEYLANVANRNGYRKSMQLWLPVLPQMLYLDQLRGYTENAITSSGYRNIKGSDWNLEAFIGLYDDPSNQAQNPVIINFAENGHLAVCGSVVSGKSTFMQSLIYSLINRYSPQHVNFYLFDFSSKMMSAFEESAHVGGVMYENDLDKIAKFFNMINGILEERKELFRGGNYMQYVRVNGIKLPSIFICIDNYEAFRSKTGNLYDSLILKLSSEAVSYGIYLVLSSGGFGTNEIPNSLADNIKSTVCLEMGDKFKYGEILKTMRFDVMPESNIRGRGLTSINESILEFHTALAFEAPDDYTRLEKIKERCRWLNTMCNGVSARPVPQIPKNPEWKNITSHSDFKKYISDDYSLPVGYNEVDASLHCINLSAIYTYMLSGKKKTGKSNMLKLMAASFKAKGADVCIIDTGSVELKLFADELGVQFVNSEEDLTKYLEGLVDIFIPRNQKKKQLIAEGANENAIYKAMLSEKRTAVLINDLEGFINVIRKPLPSKKYNFDSIMNNLFEKGHCHNIFFVAGISPESSGMLAGIPLYTRFIADKQGIHFGGNTVSQKLFDFSDLKFAEQSKATKPGLGLIATDEGTQKVIIPVYEQEG
ncbi:MAG: type VII secretion protein EssC [Clostridia bacterium]|nr:type VII secretion protein EssC [Clostridia bacterium]